MRIIINILISYFILVIEKEDEDPEEELREALRTVF